MAMIDTPEAAMRLARAITSDTKERLSLVLYAAGIALAFLQPLLGLVPFALASLGAAVLTVMFETRHVVRDGAEWEWAATLPERLVVAGKILTFYLTHAIWPSGLAFIYDPWTVDASRPTAWIPIIAWVVGCLVLLMLTKARGGPFRSLTFVALSFVVWLAPVLGFFRVYFMRYSYVQDHFAYVALLVLVPGTVGMVAAATRPTPVARIAPIAGVLVAAPQRSVSLP